jgi:hypothetical protein
MNPSAARAPRAPRDRATRKTRSDRIVGSSRAIQDVIEHPSPRQPRTCPCGSRGRSAAARSRWRARSTAGAPRGDGPSSWCHRRRARALRGRELFGCAEATYPELPQAHEGALARAAGGTLLIDHAELLSGDLWQALAKAIADGRFERQGDSGARELAARVIAISREALPSAALRDLPHHAIEVPPLAQRPEDILPLASHFLALAAADAGVAAVGFTSDARAALVSDPWPGNVRELAERIGQALRLVDTGAISSEALLIAAPPEQIPSFKDAKARVRAPLCDRPPAPLRRQHQPRGAARQEGPQGLLRRDPPHRRRSDRVPLARGGLPDRPRPPSSSSPRATTSPRTSPRPKRSCARPPRRARP